MHISATFIRRPIATSLLTAAVLLVGGISYFYIPNAPVPQIEFPTIGVRATLPGASPETLASAVATPLERQFGKIAGVTEMTSSSQLGSTSVTLQFELDRDITSAARDVQAAINAAAGQLPSDLPSLPSYKISNPAESSIIILAMWSDTVTMPKMYDYADSIAGQKLSQVQGVGQVNIMGSSAPAVRVDVNPMALAHYGIGLEDVRDALKAANVNAPKGAIEGQDNRWMISTSDQLLQADEYKPLIVAYRRGGAIRLSDVAEVADASVDVRTAGWANGKPSVMLYVNRVPGANMLDTIARIKALIPEIKASIPPSITMGIIADKAVTIRASLDDIEFTLALTVALVVMVIFLFLRNIWATIIPSIAVPLSLIGTFGVMYLLGYSLDNLSLLALAISTGFVVDDAIVVIENIARYLEEGFGPVEAAMKGSREIGFTVLSMSISLCAVFIPILLMGGILGRLFREFAVTLSTAIGISLVVSLSTTPMMCSRFLKPVTEAGHGRIYRAFERAFEWSVDVYATGLRWVLRHQPFMLALTIATFILSIYLYIIIPKGFFPQQDTGRLDGTILGAQDMSFNTMKEKMKQYLDIMQSDPAANNVTVSSFGGAENTAQARIDLKSMEERKVNAFQVISRMRRKLGTVAGASLTLQSRQEINVGARMSGAQFQYTLQSDDIRELEEWSPKVLAEMRRMRTLRDLSSDQQDRGLEATLVVDRDTASRLGIPQQVIDNTLYDAFGQRQVSTMYTQLNEYHVVMEVDPRFQQSTDAIQQLYVRSSSGTQVPLSAFTHFERKTSTLQVNHQGQYPAVTISFNLADGSALGDAVKEIEAGTLHLGLPSNIHATFQGSAKAFQSSLESEPWLILAAVVCVYLVLGMLYESYIHPLTILSTLPSAGVGALLALILFKTELNVIALVGIILLIGIVKKNAIMMIDFALDAERRKGLSPEKAIYEACLLRFRPIMMTTMCALLGGLPLALGNGTGSELRKPLGISIVGGLIVSQMLTLYTTPVVYLYMNKIQLQFERRHRKPVLSGEAPPQLPSAGD